MTTKVVSKLEPKNSGAFPTHSDIHTEGGFQVRADPTDRDSIPTANRKQGMWVKLVSDGLVYQLGSGLTNSDWTVVTFGAAAVVVFDGGSTSENIKSNRATTPSPIDNTKDGIVNLGSSTTMTNGAQGNYSTISGGDGNNATADYATCGGGVSNTTSGQYSTISGGFSNTINGDQSTIGGGGGNITAANNTTVSGGAGNQANGTGSTIGGGASNVTAGNFATIGGGQSNNINNQVGTIAGGSTNVINADNATISGGTNNTISSGADYSVITGGYNNQSFGNSSIVTGFEAKSDKSGQYVHSCGNKDGAPGGGSQFSRLVYFAESVNAATVNFIEGITNGSYTLENNRSYAMKITVVATQSAGAAAEMKIFEILVTTDNSGAATVLPASPPAPVSTVGGTTYVIDYTTSANLFNLTFTGASGVTVRATAVIEATELLFN